MPTRRRWIGWVIGLVTVFLVLTIGWVFVRGFGAVTELQYVRTTAAQLHSALADREFDRADRIAPRVAEHAAVAHDLTSDPVWRGFEFIPWLGTNFTALREMAEITDDVAADAVTPLTALSRDLDVASFGLSGATVALAPLQPVSGQLASSAEALGAAAARAQRVSADGALPQVADAVHQMRDAIHESAAIIGAAHSAASLLPNMLGDSGPRNHLVVLQNNASLRSQGGAPVAFMLVRADNGAMSFIRTASAGEFAVLDEPLPLDETTATLFGDEVGRSIAEATSLPEFAGAGGMIAQRWQQQFGDVIDTVVGVDVDTAAYLLDVIGEVSFGEFTADADTIVPIIAEDIPATIPDAAGQDAAYVQAATSVMAAMLSSKDSSSILGALADAASDDRIRIWSAHADEQAVLAASALGGSLPTDDEDDVHVGVLLNNATGGPLDAYTSASMSTAVGVCHGEPTTQVTVTWANSASGDLALAHSEDLTPGQTRTLIAIYGPEGASTDDPTATMADRPVKQFDLTLSPGESTTVTATFTNSEEHDERMLHLHRTPMLDDSDVTRTDLVCG